MNKKHENKLKLSKKNKIIKIKKERTPRNEDMRNGN